MTGSNIILVALLIAMIFWFPAMDDMRLFADRQMDTMHATTDTVQAAIPDSLHMGASMVAEQPILAPHRTARAVDRWLRINTNEPYRAMYAQARIQAYPAALSLRTVTIHLNRYLAENRFVESRNAAIIERIPQTAD